MRNFLLLLSDLVYRFQFDMSWYFTVPVVVSVLLLGALAAYLLRSRKPALITAASVTTVYMLYALSERTMLDWRLAQLAFRHFPR